MKKNAIQLAIIGVIGFTAATAQATVLNAGDRLTITQGTCYANSSSSCVGLANPSGQGSFFAMDQNSDGIINANEKYGVSQGTQGIVIGAIQPLGTPTHAGAPLPSDWGPIIAPYEFINNTAEEYTTSPITGSTQTGLDFSGLRWSYAAISSTTNVDFGTGAWGTGYTDGIANFSWDGVYGDAYTLDYHATVPSGAFINVPVAYHLEGFVLQAVPLPASAWLFGSGLIGIMGLSRRRKI